MVKTLLLLLSFMYLIGCVRLPQPTRDFTPQEIANRLLKSTVVIRVIRSNPYRVSRGSGFVIKHGYIATNYHVVRGMKLKQSKVRLTGSDKYLPIESVVAYDRDYDLAIIRCSRVKAPPLTLGNSRNLQIGETVYVTGSPRGYTGTFSVGVISSLRDNKFKSGDDIIQFSAPVSPGSSGSPITNSKCEVIGIVRARVHATRDINFATPVNAIKPLLESTW